MCCSRRCSLAFPRSRPATAVTVFGMMLDRVPVEAPTDQEIRDVEKSGDAAASAKLQQERERAASDRGTLLKITYGIIAITLVILMFGGTIERMLEIASWFMIAYIFIFLIAVNLWFVPGSIWLSTLAGFFEFGNWPTGVEPLLMATFFATAGSGGIGNLTISNWIRDKGFGMGAVVGRDPQRGRRQRGPAVARRQSVRDHDGQHARWRLWWRYVVLDQVWLWALGCFCGMFLNVNLARAIIPHGTDLSKVGAGRVSGSVHGRQFLARAVDFGIAQRLLDFIFDAAWQHRRAGPHADRHAVDRQLASPPLGATVRSRRSTTRCCWSSRRGVCSRYIWEVR